VKTIYCIALLFAFVACRPAEISVAEAPDVEDLPPFDPATQQTVAYLNIEHVKHFLESNPDVFVLDVRTLEEYDKVHLPGAVSFPYDFKKKTIKKVLAAHPDYKTKNTYFFYGSNENYYEIDVSMHFRNLGYQYLFCMNGGIEDWIKDGLPVMSTVAE